MAPFGQVVATPMHMAMTPICFIFWSLIDNVEKLLCANFQP